MLKKLYMLKTKKKPFLICQNAKNLYVTTNFRQWLKIKSEVIVERELKKKPLIWLTIDILMNR